MQVDWNIILNLAALQICTCCVEENKTEVAVDGGGGDDYN